MSSIAYVTNDQMLEYHRLCRNRSILFWRLTTKNRFKDFRKGDLLFFFAKGKHSSRNKSLVGYGHYMDTKKLSINQMWKLYGNKTGFDTKEQLSDAINKSAKGEIPSQMLCLLLTDVVFFTSPVNPKSVGLDIPKNLESYTYLDREDPQVTVRILKEAERYGIDLWSYDDDVSPEDIFEKDEIRHILSLAHHDMGKEIGTERERIASHKLFKAQIQKDGWEAVRDSKTDCVKITDHRVEIAIPLTYGATDKEARLRDFLGRMAMYTYYMKKISTSKSIQFVPLMEEGDAEMEALVKELVK